jgi:hypothetical protein
MAKVGKSAAELLDLINGELRRYDVCDNVSATRVIRVEDPRSEHNWTSDYLRGSPTSAVSDCERIFAATIDELRERYFLVGED